MSAFDPSSFLESVTTEAGSTKRDPIPQSDYYGIVDDIKLEEVQTKGGETRHILRIIWDLQDQELKTQLDRDKVTIRQDCWLDLDGAQLDWSKGKNIDLGRVREALGQNQPGVPWSPSMLKGSGPALVSVVLKQSKENRDEFFSNVSKVGKIS